MFPPAAAYPSAGAVYRTFTQIPQNLSRTILKGLFVNRLLGAFRFVAVFFVAVTGLAFVLFVGMFPIRIRDSLLSAWICTGLARCFNLIFNVQYTCHGADKLRTHRGFIFPNHVSYMEPILLFSICPQRFLAAIEVQRRPIVGQLAGAVGTVYVERERRTSRLEARDAIVNALLKEPGASLVLFPEGKLGPGNRLIPFRYGAFKMATQNRIPYIPCAIRYERPDIVVWNGGRGESMLTALWRLACFPGPTRAHITFFDVVQPAPEDYAAQLARVTEYTVARELGFIHIEEGAAEKVRGAK